MDKLDIIDRIEFLEDGVNAARILAAGRNEAIGCCIEEDEYNNAQAWIFDHLTNEFHSLRAELTADAFRERKEINQAAG